MARLASNVDVLIGLLSTLIVLCVDARVASNHTVRSMSELAPVSNQRYDTVRYDRRV